MSHCLPLFSTPKLFRNDYVDIPHSSHVCSIDSVNAGYSHFDNVSVKYSLYILGANGF